LGYDEPKIVFFLLYWIAPMGFQALANSKDNFD